VAGAIFGDWTHRRADGGGTRALPAELGRAKLRVAWTWEAPAATRIDQVRTTGEFVVVAAMGMAEDAAGWEHATVVVLDAATGKVAGRRVLPDPVPVSSLAVEGHVVQIVATSPGESLFTYALSIPNLRPLHRGVVRLEDPGRFDVLDAWALPGGGLWLELEAGEGSVEYVAVAATPGESSLPRLVLPVGPFASARDACESERALFVPAEPEAHEATSPTPLLFKLDPEREEQVERPGRTRTTVWAHAETGGQVFRTRALAHEGLVYAVLVGVAPASSTQGDLVAGVIALDRTAAVERYRTPLARFPSSLPGERARIVFANAEVAFQLLSAEGKPCSDVLLAGRGNALEPITLGAKRRFILDAALGGLLLAHATKADGHVVVAVFDLDAKAGILGRRARMHVSAETPEVGGTPTVYAGAGRIFVKGERRLVALGV
jgi:hypothetical protein